MKKRQSFAGEQKRFA